VAINPLGAALAWSQIQRLDEILGRRQRQREAYRTKGLRDFTPYGNGWLHVGYRGSVRAMPTCDIWEPMHRAPHLCAPDRGDNYPTATAAWRDLVALPSSDDLEG
jgi:hypothetical protein